VKVQVAATFDCQQQEGEEKTEEKPHSTSESDSEVKNAVKNTDKEDQQQTWNEASGREGEGSWETPREANEDILRHGSSENNNTFT
jgi:hypothetical protein